MSHVARSGLALLVVCAAAGSARAQQSAITVTISTRGAAVQVDLDCAVSRDGIERHERHHGVAPLSLTFAASGLSCAINAAGAVTIETQNADGSNVSRIQTSGGQTYLVLSSN